VQWETTAVNFNIYLDSTLGEALKRLAKRRKVTRNALIRKAVEELVNKESRSEEWSAEVLAWQGDPRFEPFESHRAHLRAPASDPLA
jgi:predicted transcriptional regulator